MASPPQIDFGALGDLANEYRRGQQRTAIEQMYPGSGGDLTLAQLALANQRDVRDFGFRQQESARAQTNADRAYELQRVAQQEKPTFGVIGKDQNGNDVHGFIDPSKRSVSPVSAQPAQGAGMSGGNASLTGDAFLQTQDPGRANQIRAIAEGRMSPPGGMSLKSPQIQGLMRDVAQYEPGFDLTSWTARNKTRADLSSGKMGQNISSFNTAIGHLETLNDAAEALGNSRFPAYNTVSNMALSATGDPRINKFEVARTAVADELTRAFRGTGGNVHDLVQWEKAINAAGSPAQLKAAISQAVELLRSRIEAVGDQYNRGMGKTTDPLKLLSPKAATAIRKLSGEAEPPPEQPPATAPQPQSFNWRTKETITAARANPQETIAQARAAVANGMPMQEAAARLRASGIDPTALGNTGFAGPDVR